MKNRPSIAMFFIAITLITTRAMAENVYRCGNSYSQTPCPDGKTMEVQDTRTSAQKAQTDAATQRTTSAADAMERERLQKEAQLQAANAKAIAQAKKLAAESAAADAPAHGASTTQRNAFRHPTDSNGRTEHFYRYAPRSAAGQKHRGSSKPGK